MVEKSPCIRTMEFIGVDFWDRPVYKCLENGFLWKDISLGQSNTPDLHSSSNNEFDGEPCSPIREDLVVVYKTKYEENPYRSTYMMLGRLKSDCDYYLGYGCRSDKNLWAGSVTEQINSMMEFYNSLPEGHKPEWLSFDDILDYKKKMNE